MKKTLLLAIFAVFSLTASFGQSKSFWSNIPYDRAENLGDVKETFEGITTNLFQVNLVGLSAALANAPERFTGGSGVMIICRSI